MDQIALIPMVSMVWEVRIAGRVLGGVAQVPDYDGGIEQVTRVLAAELQRGFGVTARDLDGPHVFVFRRAEP